MLDDDTDQRHGPVSRRAVLQAAGAVGGLAAASGVASGASEVDEHNVGIAPGATRAEEVAKRVAESVRKTIDLGTYGRVVVGTFSAEAREKLERTRNVEYVEPNYTAEKLGEKLPWGIDRVDADVLHSEGTTGNGATVAILDTGVDDDHPDLANNIDPSLGAAFGSECGSESGGCRFGLEGYNGNDCNYKWSDDDDHGSHVAGTANAIRGNNEGVAGGVSTEATIMPVKVLSGCGSGSYADIADGIKYAADNGADVINMSLGGSSGDSTLKNACQYAYDNGVLLVAAAGNDGPCTDCVSYPAKYSTVMAISATDPDDTLADYSSTGPEVELAGPGTDVLSTIPPESEDDSNDGYEKFSGTSMATPHVAGAAGQVFAETSLSDNGKVRTQLKNSAEDIGLASNEQGAGLVDAEAAVGTASSDPSPSVDSLSATEVETSDGDAEFDVSWDVSDDEGDLSSVDLYLLDSSGSTEDSASVSVSGSSASGTNRLVASGDEGSGDSYTVELTVTDSNSNSTTSSVSASESEDSPTVDSLSASEVETGDSDAEFDVSWDVSDNDGDLSSVDLTLTQDSDDTTEDTASISVSGSSASGTTRLVASGDDGSGNSYTVSATVSDTDGTTGSGSTIVSETENTSSAPTVDSHSTSTRTTGPWYRVTADWGVSDDDGDLDSVDVAIEDGNGNTLSSTTVDVSGSNASGSNELKSRSKPSESVVTVTDSKGNSDTSTKSVSF